MSSAHSIVQLCAQVKTQSEGVFLDRRLTALAEVMVLRGEKDKTWLRIALREGRKRQIRSMHLDIQDWLDTRPR